MNNYYVDSCIYLNLWKKETGIFGKPYWKIAKRFFEKAELQNSIIYYSGYLLKELSFVLDEQKFHKKLKTFEYSPNFIRTNLSNDGINQCPIL